VSVPLVRCVLQRVAACCSVLQCAELSWRMLRRVAVCCSVLQCAAACRSVVQRPAVCCSVLQCGPVWCSVLQHVLECVAACCSVLQCVAVLLQQRDSHDAQVLSRVAEKCVAVRCSVLQLQCVAVCCKVSRALPRVAAKTHARSRTWKWKDLAEVVPISETTTQLVKRVEHVLTHAHELGN